MRIALPKRLPQLVIVVVGRSLFSHSFNPTRRLYYMKDRVCDRAHATARSATRRMRLRCPIKARLSSPFLPERTPCSVHAPVVVDHLLAAMGPLSNPSYVGWCHQTSQEEETCWQMKRFLKWVTQRQATHGSNPESHIPKKTTGEDPRELRPEEEERQNARKPWSAKAPPSRRKKPRPRKRGKHSEPEARKNSDTGRGFDHLSEEAKRDIIYRFCRGFEEDWNLAAFGGRLRLLEVCCDPKSELSSACEKMFGSGSAQRFSHLNGGDLETKSGEDFVCGVIKEKRRGLVWISPECGPYSPMQNLNQRTEQQKKQLQEKRERAKRQCEAACHIGEFCHQEGIPFVIELSERCQGGTFLRLRNFRTKCNVFLERARGVRWGLGTKRGFL